MKSRHLIFSVHSRKQASSVLADDRRFGAQYLILILLCCSFLPALAHAQTIRTVAGGLADGPAAIAPLAFPEDVAVDASGNLYIVDYGNDRIARVDAVTKVITTIAGNGTPGFSGDGGPATAAMLSAPQAVAVDVWGNVYIAEAFPNARVRRVDAATQVITTVAGGSPFGPGGDGGPATAATVHAFGVTVDASGNLYISDSGERIRKVNATTQIITTVAGGGAGGDGGPATAASLNYARGITLDASGNLYIAEVTGRRVRRVDAATQIITTVAGGGSGGDGGPATSAALGAVYDVAVDTSGNLYIADSGFNRIRRVDGVTKIITTVAGRAGGFSGDGGPATAAELANPHAVAVDTTGNIYIADTFNERIRKVDGATKVITTVVANGTFGDGGFATAAGLRAPTGVAIDAYGNLYIADYHSHRVRKVDAVTQIITTIAGGGRQYQPEDGDGGPATSAYVYNPSGVAIDAAGNIYIAVSTNPGRIRKVDAVTQTITTVAGGGSGEDTLAFPEDVTVDAAGNLYIADTENHRIRKVDASTKNITTVAGVGGGNYFGDSGPATAAYLFSPSGIAVDAFGNLYIADTGNHRIRKVDAATKIITTIAGNGRTDFSGDGGPATAASLLSPNDVAVDASGNLYIADTDNRRIRKVDASTKIISTLAGSGASGFSGDGGPATAAALRLASSVTVGASGNVFFADFYNRRVRGIFPTSPTPRRRPIRR